MRGAQGGTFLVGEGGSLREDFFTALDALHGTWGTIPVAGRDGEDKLLEGEWHVRPFEATLDLAPSNGFTKLEIPAKVGGSPVHGGFAVALPSPGVRRVVPGGAIIAEEWSTDPIELLHVHIFFGGRR